MAKNSLKLVAFNNELFGEVRTVDIDGKIYFVAKDVAKALGYKDTDDAIRKHCKHPITKPGVLPGKGRPLKLIAEGDVYRLIVRSKLPTAEKFEIWVFDEVLPQIRATGGYIPVNEDDDEKTIMAKALQIMERTIKEKDTIIENQQDTIDYLTMTSVKGKTLDDISSATGVSKKEIEFYCFNNNWYHRFDKDVLIDKECYVSRTGKNRIEFTKEGFDVLVKVFQPKKFKNLF